MVHFMLLVILLSGSGFGRPAAMAGQPPPLSGTVTYYLHGAENIPLPDMRIRLIDAGGQVIDSANTCIGGYYAFYDRALLSMAREIEVATFLPHGGLTAIDELAVQRRALYLPLPGFWDPEYDDFLCHVGNVWIGVSPVNTLTGPPLNAADAYHIRRRMAFPETTTFDAGNWAFYSPADRTIFDRVYLNGALLPNQARRPYRQGVSRLDIVARVYGDVSGSYKPPASPGTDGAIAPLRTGEHFRTQPGEPFEVLLSVDRRIEFSALDLVLLYDTAKIKLSFVGAIDPDILVSHSDGQIRAIWAGIQPLAVKSGEALISLSLVAKAPIEPGDPIFTPVNQFPFADRLGRSITGVRPVIVPPDTSPIEYNGPASPKLSHPKLPSYPSLSDHFPVIP